MSTIKLLLTVAFLCGMCFAASANEQDAFDLVCEYPARDAVYASASDFVVTGSSKQYGRAITVYFRDAKNVVHQSLNCQAGAANSNGTWSCQVSLPRIQRLKPGRYTVEMRSDGIPLVAIPISIASDPTGPQFPHPLPLTQVDSVEYGRLPLLKLADVTLSNSDFNMPDVRDSKPIEDREFTIDWDREFAVEGSFLTAEIPEMRPAGVVIRLTASLVDGDNNNRQVQATVTDSFTDSDSTNDTQLFRYRQVLRAPHRTGKLTLEAIYREKVIASAAIEVRRSLQPAPNVAFVIEHPPPDALYAPSSEIVVAGKGPKFNDRIDVTLSDPSGGQDSYAMPKVGNADQDGAWSSRLYLRKGAARRPGTYQLAILPRSAVHQLLPITIVADANSPEAPSEISTKIGSEAYDDLPRLDLPGVILASPDSDQPQVISLEKVKRSQFVIAPGQEFAVRGELGFKNRGNCVPFDVIIRITGIPKDRKVSSDAKVTMCEAVGQYQLAVQPDEYPFCSVLRAPHYAGTFIVETIYRRAVVAATAIDVRTPEHK